MNAIMVFTVELSLIHPKDLLDSLLSGTRRTGVYEDSPIRSTALQYDTSTHRGPMTGTGKSFLPSDT